MDKYQQVLKLCHGNKIVANDICNSLEIPRGPNLQLSPQFLSALNDETSTSGYFPRLYKASSVSDDCLFLLTDFQNLYSLENKRQEIINKAIELATTFREKLGIVDYLTSHRIRPEIPAASLASTVLSKMTEIGTFDDWYGIYIDQGSSKSLKEYSLEQLIRLTSTSLHISQ